MTFPGYNAQVYYNEDGEPLGWDYPSYDDAPEQDYADSDEIFYVPDEDRLWGDEAACRAEDVHGQDARQNKYGTWSCDWCGEDCTAEVAED